MQRSAQRNEGMALMLAMLAAIVIFGAVGAVVYRTHSAKRSADFDVARNVSNEAIKAGIDLGVAQIWNDYVVGSGNTTGNLASYLVFINDVVPNNEDLNGNGVMDDEDEWDFNGDGSFTVNSPVNLVDAGNPLTLESGAVIDEVTLARTDDVTGVNLTITSTASYGGYTFSGRQTLRVGGELFRGFEYAVLANNVNCILCHAQFKPLDLERNTDPTNYGNFDRIKVAALESLLVRTSEANSRLAGTMYTRGIVYGQDGSPLSASQIATSTFRGYEFSDTNGKIYQDPMTGDMSAVSMANADFDDEGQLEQFANLYMNYPTDPKQMTDGNLPERFPAPFPDDNGDRIVNDSEFETIVNSANGYITFELDPSEIGGSIQGGVAYGVPQGQTYSGTSLPSASNEALTSLSDDGSYDGNLILIGTDYDPIRIEKRVAVDGDLIIKGPVKGWGQLLVKGNIYVIGDVTYKDAPGEFGVADDGTKNGLAMTAGGSIMLGDYTTVRAKNDIGDNSTWQGKFIDYRAQNKTVRMRNRANTNVGYFDDGVVDPGFPVGAEDQISFTTSELMLFNRMEYLKAQGDPGYTPRYYRLRPSQPIYQYVGNDEHTVHYNDPDVEIITDLSNAVIQDLNPQDFWMTEEQLRNFWWQDEMSRPDSGRPFQVDGLMYSNNSIFALTHSKGRHNSNTMGQMIVRGSIVTADLGMLVPGPDFSTTRTGLELFYDRRVADFFRVEDTTRVQFRRMTYRPWSTNGSAGAES